MQRLIGELLDHARVQAGESLELERRPTYLVALAQRVGKDLQRPTTRPASRRGRSSGLVVSWHAACFYG
jgi:hypothetical protein